MGKLTIYQWIVLDTLSRSQAARTAGSDISALRKLAKEGLAIHQGGSGRFSTWKITDAGRRALSEGDRHGSCDRHG